MKIVLPSLKGGAVLVAAASFLTASAQSSGLFDFADRNFLYKITSPSTVQIVSDPNVQNGIRYIGDIVIPDEVTEKGVTYRVTSIAASAFSFADQMTSITLGSNLEEIGMAAFSNCKEITEVIFPASMRTVSMGAFLHCPALVNVELNEGLTTIMGGAFSSCAFSEIEIPASVTIIQNGAFGLNSELEEIKVAEGNRYFTAADGILYSKDLSTLVCYPAGKPDTEFTVPSTTKVIYESSFEGANNIVSLTLPESITEYQSAVFYDCRGLRNVYCLNPKPVRLPDASVFENFTYENAFLFVPAESVDEYKNAVYWQKFKEILPNNAVLVTEIKLNEESLNMEYGDQFQLTAEVLPENASSKNVVWATDNDPVAAVDATGLVTAYENGTANITCATPNGSVKAVCKVTVSEESAVDSVAGEGVFRIEGNTLIIGGDSEAEVYDFSGRLIYKGIGSTELPNGFYIIRIGGNAYKTAI